MKNLMLFLAHRKTIVAVSLLTAVCLLGDSMLYVALPIYYTEARLSSLWEVGLILSINRFVRLPLNPVIGWLYRKISWKTGLWIGLLLSMVSTIGYGYGNGLWVWLMLRLVWGCAWSLLRIGGLMVVVNHSGMNDQGEGMGLYNGLYRLGSLVGMIAGAILAAGIGFAPTASVLGILPLFVIPFMRLIRDDSQNGLHYKKESKTSRCTGEEMVVLVTGFIVAFYIQGVVTSTLSYLVTSRYPEVISFGLFFIQSTILAGVLLGLRWVWEPFLAVWIGRWSDRHGRISIFLLSLLLFAAELGVIPVQLPVGYWVALVIVLLLTSTILTTLVDTLMSTVAKETSVNRMSMLYSLATDLGAALGPLWGYVWLGRHAGEWVVYLSGTILCLSVFVVWFGKMRTKNDAK
jgi:MFS family permease